MAAVGEAPTLFLRKATGLVKGWSKFDAFLYSFMSVNFVTLGLFFAFSVLAFVPTGQVLPALLISGVFVIVPGRHVRRAHLGDAARGRRLRLAEPGARRRHRVRAGVTGWWFILWYWAPIYGNILNVEVFQPLAAIFKLDGVSDVPRVEQRPVLRVRGDGAPRRIPRVPRHGGVREGPEVLLLHRHGGARRRLPGDAVRFSERFPERVQPGGGEPVRRRAATCTPRRSRSGRRTMPGRSCRSSGFSPFFGPTPAAGPVPVLLDPLAELGRDALRRGPRRERLQARHERDDVGSVGHRRAWRWCSCSSPRSSSGGSSSTPRT